MPNPRAMKKNRPFQWVGVGVTFRVDLLEGVAHGAPAPARRDPPEQAEPPPSVVRATSLNSVELPNYCSIQPEAP